MAMGKIIPSPPVTQASLADRVASLRSELEAAIDDLAAKIKESSPSQPLESIRRMITRHTACTCAAYLIALKETS